jgi:hypothetical protein
MATEYFRDLGNAVGERWSARGHDKHAFADVAFELLEERPAHSHVVPLDLLETVVRTPGYENRGSSDTFGQPAVPVFLHARFHIEILYWFHAAPGIHEHNFTGAFQVLSGSSVHASYAFDVAEEVHPQLQVGKTRLRSIELLARGDTRVILPHPQFAHALFHLEQPSTTIVVRLPSDPAFSPAMLYLPPGLAMDGHFADRSIALRRRALGAAVSMAPIHLERLTRQAIVGADPMALFSFLQTYANLEKDERKKLSFFNEVAETHGPLVTQIRLALEEQHRMAAIVRRRQVIRSPELRFFLALMINCPDRRSVLDMVARRFPERGPVDAVMSWIEELTRLPSIVGPAEPNALGFHLSAEGLERVARALRGDSDEVLAAPILRPLFTSTSSGLAQPPDPVA